MRVLLPQMYDGDHPYAVDVTKIDEAFGAIARVVNGGMDDGNLSDTLMFANDTSPLAVNYAFAAPYSRMTLRAVMDGDPVVTVANAGCLPPGCSIGTDLYVGGFAWTGAGAAPTVTFSVGGTTVWSGTMTMVGDPTGKYVTVRTKDREAGIDDWDGDGKPEWLYTTVEKWIITGAKYELRDSGVLPLGAQTALEAGNPVLVTVSGAPISHLSIFEISFPLKQVA